jgi:hypothetical protein
LLLSFLFVSLSQSPSLAQISLPDLLLGLQPGAELAGVVCWLTGWLSPFVARAWLARCPWWLAAKPRGASGVGWWVRARALAGVQSADNFALQTLQQDAAAGTAEAPAPRGVFGPLKFEPEDRVDGVEEDEEDSEMEVEVDDIESNPRKRLAERQHHHDELVSHGSPAKRQRLSNGYENGADSGAAPMEIDQRPDTTNHHAYPSPLEGEQAESPLLRTEGPSRGTQVEKAHDLTQNTVFLQLGAADGAADHEAAAESPLVLLCEWNPRDPLVLATAGTDALARIWTLPYRETSPSDAISIVDDDLPKNATISAMAWSSNGELIAVAADLGLKSRVSIYSVEGTSLHRVDGLDSPVTNLCWSPNGSLLLSICPDVSKGLASPGTLIHISSPSLANSMSHHLAHDLRTDTLDTTWISETEFILCGGDLLVSFRCTENGIVQGREFKTGKDERFTLVEFDWRSKLVATASEKGFIDVSIFARLWRFYFACLLTYLRSSDLGRSRESPHDSRP